MFNLQIYDDLLAAKKKPSIIVDGADETVEDTPILSTDIPQGFFTFGYFAHSVVKAHKGKYHFN
jgi:hypothetical protein